VAHPALQEALHQVPFVALLGVTVEEATPQELVLRLPFAPTHRGVDGALFGAAVFAVGELAATAALLAHPELADRAIRQTSSRITYQGTATSDVTAHARVTAELLELMRAAWSGGQEASVDVPVRVLDGYGNDVAVVTPRFSVA
jgi:acyl-coenzyme A thioesterase PaaI-like protein